MIAQTTASRLSTGKTPGRAMSTTLACALGAAPKATLLKATILAKGGRGNEAVALVEGLLTKFPGQPGLVLEKAKMLDLVGRGNEADPIYAQLKAQFPDDPSLAAAIQARGGL